MLSCTNINASEPIVDRIFLKSELNIDVENFCKKKRVVELSETAGSEFENSAHWCDSSQ